VLQLSRSRLRVVTLGSALVGVCLVATGCVTASGSGTVTITSTTPASANTVAYVCAGTQSSCSSTDPYQYTYRPSVGVDEVVVSPGFSVVDRSDNAVPLPAGQYTVTVFDNIFGPRDSTVLIDVYSDRSQERDLSIWHQSTGRANESDSCPMEWEPSWAQWPNDGAGGFVCNHRSYIYYPHLPVASPHSAEASTPWVQSIGRVSADDECPDGYKPGWAQWPNAGSGGYTCDRTVE
jgi:hypothetical protein